MNLSTIDVGITFTSMTEVLPSNAQKLVIYAKCTL